MLGRADHGVAAAPAYRGFQAGDAGQPRTQREHPGPAQPRAVRPTPVRRGTFREQQVDPAAGHVQVGPVARVAVGHLPPHVAGLGDPAVPEQLADRSGGPAAVQVGGADRGRYAGQLLPPGVRVGPQLQVGEGDPDAGLPDLVVAGPGGVPQAALREFGVRAGQLGRRVEQALGHPRRAGRIDGQQVRRDGGGRCAVPVQRGGHPAVQIGPDQVGQPVEHGPHQRGIAESAVGDQAGRGAGPQRRRRRRCRSRRRRCLRRRRWRRLRWRPWRPWRSWRCRWRRWRCRWHRRRRARGEHAGHGPGGEPATGDRQHMYRGAHVRLAPEQAAEHRVAERVAEDQPAGRVRAAEGVVQQGAHQPRVAAGDAVALGAELARRLGAAPVGEDLADPGRGQHAEAHPADPGRVQQRGERRRARAGAFRLGQQQPDRRRPRTPDQVGQAAQRGGVGLVDVVDHEDRRRFAGPVRRGRADQVADVPYGLVQVLRVGRHDPRAAPGQPLGERVQQLGLAGGDRPGHDNHVGAEVIGKRSVEQCELLVPFHQPHPSVPLPHVPGSRMARRRGPTA
ncbi:hypothetical protein CIK06_18155 [Plantactinospora sp. KBS50]|nr:hypothetical protein [Plantactinospora sp. KBS50]ASW55687.1 hypothetical protein CIK06_18155 [Plantactinospora sp. KBS50]